MFGYHDSPDCKFDLHSPNPTRWGNNAIENRAFSAYCMHTTELDSIANAIYDAWLHGEINFVKDIIDDISLSDVEYIEKRLKSFGLEVTMTLN